MCNMQLLLISNIEPKGQKSYESFVQHILKFISSFCESKIHQSIIIWCETKLSEYICTRHQKFIWSSAWPNRNLTNIHEMQQHNLRNSDVNHARNSSVEMCVYVSRQTKKKQLLVWWYYIPHANMYTFFAIRIDLCYYPSISNGFASMSLLFRFNASTASFSLFLSSILKQVQPFILFIVG